MANESYDFTFLNRLDEDGDSEHKYTVNSNKEEGIASIFCPSTHFDHAGLQTYIDGQQLGEFGILCYAASGMDDEDSIIELISGLMGDEALSPLAARLRKLADLLEE